MIWFIWRYNHPEQNDIVRNAMYLNLNKSITKFITIKQQEQHFDRLVGVKNLVYYLMIVKCEKNFPSESI